MNAQRLVGASPQSQPLGGTPQPPLVSGGATPGVNRTEIQGEKILIHFGHEIYEVSSLTIGSLSRPTLQDINKFFQDKLNDPEFQSTIRNSASINLVGKKCTFYNKKNDKVQEYEWKYTAGKVEKTFQLNRRQTEAAEKRPVAGEARKPAVTKEPYKMKMSREEAIEIAKREREKIQKGQSPPTKKDTEAALTTAKDTHKGVAAILRTQEAQQKLAQEAQQELLKRGAKDDETVITRKRRADLAQPLGGAAQTSPPTPVQPPQRPPKRPPPPSTAQKPVSSAPVTPPRC